MHPRDQSHKTWEPFPLRRVLEIFLSVRDCQSETGIIGNIYNFLIYLFGPYFQTGDSHSKF
jgi:hypothetical protein